jgi:5-methylcytosine-specific restriction protein B
MHAVNDTHELMQDGDGPGAARKKVKHALLKETYWNLLKNPAARAAVRQKLESMLPPGIASATILPAAIDAVEKTHFLIPDGKVARFLSALASKPFVILTGNSGTGKSKLAQLVAHWLSGHQDPNLNRYAVVPVGADWTDNRNIVGFVNHLRKSPDQKPLYQSSPTLELLLRAANDRNRPYFLILDEMNLSHVERYFSDFLSAMESKKPVPIHTEASDLSTPSGQKVGTSIPFPDNLFVIGTVNIDETTYMFSPKVLDRANVLEFRATTEEAASLLNNTKNSHLEPIQLAPPGMAAAFLKISFRARGLPEGAPPPPFEFESTHASGLAASRKTLTDIFAILHEARLEFAFRTIAEVIRYIHVDWELAPEKTQWRWQACMDAQIFQKILPKLHGSKKKLEELLMKLAGYCELGPEAKPEQKPLTDFSQQRVQRLNKPTNTKDQDPVVFRDSYEKLCDMVNIVRRDQFVSFIH